MARNFDKYLEFDGIFGARWRCVRKRQSICLLSVCYYVPPRKDLGDLLEISRCECSWRRSRDGNVVSYCSRWNEIFHICADIIAALRLCIIGEHVSTYQTSQRVNLRMSHAWLRQVHGHIEPLNYRAEYSWYFIRNFCLRVVRRPTNSFLRVEARLSFENHLENARINSDVFRVRSCVPQTG